MARLPRPRAPARPSFVVGDLVEPYRFFDGARFVEGPRKDIEGTRWRVLAIEPGEVVMELIEGRYDLYEDEAPVGPGHVVHWRNSTAWRRVVGRTHPNQQCWDQFRVCGR